MIFLELRKTEVQLRRKDLSRSEVDNERLDCPQVQSTMTSEVRFCALLAEDCAERLQLMRA